jgi:hypothetical protein
VVNKGRNCSLILNNGEDELTRKRVPGCGTGLISVERRILGKNREISGSPLVKSQPNIFPSNEKPGYKACRVTGRTKSKA